MMGNELLKIADGFSMVADGIRGLANMERNGAVDMAEKDAGVPGSAEAVDTDGNARRIFNLLMGAVRTIRFRWKMSTRLFLERLLPI